MISLIGFLTFGMVKENQLQLLTVRSVENKSDDRNLADHPTAIEERSGFENNKGSINKNDGSKNRDDSPINRNDRNNEQESLLPSQKV